MKAIPQSVKGEALKLVKDVNIFCKSKMGFLISITLNWQFPH